LYSKVILNTVTKGIKGTLITQAISDRKRTYSLFQNLLTGCGALPASYATGIGALYTEVKL
jgi:hypothetical protein